MHSWFFLSLLVHGIYSIQIGQILNVVLRLQSFSTLNILNGTREECLCAMIFSSNITMINYFSNNTCQLFSNQSLINTDFSYNIDLNSAFYFLQLPTTTTYVDCAQG